jgi:hypothetical protein
VTNEPNGGGSDGDGEDGGQFDDRLPADWYTRQDRLGMSRVFLRIVEIGNTGVSIARQLDRVSGNRLDAALAALDIQITETIAILRDEIRTKIRQERAELSLLVTRQDESMTASEVHAAFGRGELTPGEAADLLPVPPTLGQWIVGIIRRFFRRVRRTKGKR